MSDSHPATHSRSLSKAPSRKSAPDDQRLKVPEDAHPAHVKPIEETAVDRDALPSWTFLTNHSHVLVCLQNDPSMRLREIASRIGLTERGVQKILGDLEEAGVVVRDKKGRRNHYRLKTEVPLRHPLEAHRQVRDLMGMLKTGE